MAPRLQATTGDPDFDKAFRLGGRDPTALARLLDPDLRARMMAAQIPSLILRLRTNEITVFMDGLARTREDIEAMIALADALANRCELMNPSPKRQ